MMINLSWASAFGAGRHESGHRLDEHVRCLQRLDPPDEQDHLRVLGHPELRPGLRLIAGVEGVQIDPRRHHDQLFGAGVVVMLQLRRLVAGVGGEDGRVGDDLRLALLADVGLADLVRLPSVWFLTFAMVCMVWTSGTS